MSTSRRTGTAAAKPIEVSAELKALICGLKLGQLLDTLPERLALAGTNHPRTTTSLELPLADEVHRRARQCAFCVGRLSAWLLRRSSRSTWRVRGLGVEIKMTPYRSCAPPSTICSARDNCWRGAFQRRVF